MPVTFAPAQPMSTPIAEGYGATEQFDKTLPILAGLYEAGARNRLQSQQANLAADIHNQTVGAELSSREGIARDAGALHDRFQQQQMQQQRQMQERQIEAQNQAQYMNWAMHDSAVTQQEILHQQRQQQGLSQLVQMTQDGSLDMTDPNVRQMVTDVTGELKTGINFTQRRVMQQHAADMEAQSKLRDQQAARITKSEEDATKYESDLIKAGYNTIVQRDGNGYPHVLIKNKRTGEWYNPMKDTLSMTAKGNKGEEGAGGDWAHLGTNGIYDAKKGLADAKAYAEAMFPKKIEETTDDAGKVHKRDVNEAERLDLQRRRFEGTQREFKSAGQDQSQAPAPTGPTSDPAMAFQAAVERNPKLDGLAKSQAVDTYQKAVQLAQKPGRTPEEIRLLRDMLEYLEKVQGK